MQKQFVVDSDKVKYSDEYIETDYQYHTTEARVEGDAIRVRPITTEYKLRTKRKVPRVGMLIVGLGGNNGSTLYAAMTANREGISWRTATGVQEPNYWGSITQASTVRIGSNSDGEDVFLPLKGVLPMVEPNDLVVGGWDINNADLAEAMERSKVLDYDLQRQLVPFLQGVKPMPSIYVPDFIAANQEERANNVLTGSKQEMMDTVRCHIRSFKEEHKLDTVIVLWSANTERFCDVAEGLNDTADNLLASIANGAEEISPSTLYATASILEGCSYINGSPQNTFVPGLMELAEQKRVFIGGDDFKSGQTKMKSVMVDWLIGAGIKPVSIVSYNHLGNNDGKNLSAPQQFRSKEISKSNVVDDMVASNSILYAEGEHPDHTVVIKYVPYVGDSKRAMDEYTSRIFMGGHSTISMHNTCEDSLLAAPIILDLVILTELLERIEWSREDAPDFQRLHPVMSILSYLVKAPLVPTNTPVVNALMAQKAAIENFMLACVGLPPHNHMRLEHKAIPIRTKA